MIFDEIHERVYTVWCEGYFDKNGKSLDDEASMKYLTGEKQIEICSELELYDENGDIIDYMDSSIWLRIWTGY